ncbi:MAG TPA: DUF488 domain-containing protein [Gammaproteobacteria bacterium]|nr:DUF488 domain-containing protein [Gammaproteobacteria bacterium]
MPKKLYTIGHSTHSLEEFMEILQAHNIKQLIDVRTVPKSRHVPWSNSPQLKASLAKRKIAYKHLSALGGLRSTNKNSINGAWRNKSFRGYADYMQTENFFTGLKILMQFIKDKQNVVIMCAEAVPWRCHRSLIADALLVRNYKVWHIYSRTSVKLHKMTSFSKVDRSKRPIKVYYPA